MQYFNNLDKRNFIRYKFINSLITGLAMGSVFTIYSSLQPSVFSLGGIVLAIALFIVAKLYVKILHPKIFYRISLFVEIVVLVMISYFLLFPSYYTTALFVYICYQVSFMFGGYLVRAETLFFPRATLLSFIDTAKQKGYLIGLTFSYIFYEGLQFYEIINKQIQVYYLHIGLFFLQLLTLYFLYKVFR